MHRLLNYALEDPSEIAGLREAALQSPDEPAAMIGLGLALAKNSCTYEASQILRPLRVEWKSTPDASQAKAALDAQAWWNKNGLEFARIKHAKKRKAALALLGSRAVDYWDQPALLLHLSDFAAEDRAYDLAAHLLQRVAILSDRGLPKMDMTAFAFASRAGLVDVLLDQELAQEGRAAFEQLPPHAANAMSYEILDIRTLAALGEADRAMKAVAALIIVALTQRQGYSRTIRLDFVASSKDLAELRSRDDWSVMLEDPKAYLKRSV